MEAWMGKAGAFLIGTCIVHAANAPKQKNPKKTWHDEVLLRLLYGKTIFCTGTVVSIRAIRWGLVSVLLGFGLGGQTRRHADTQTRCRHAVIHAGFIFPK